MDGALGVYQSKRDFTQKPQPASGGQSVADQLRFVVQKHWASSLHYDFQLELDGTLKRWAVPKGPSYGRARLCLQAEPGECRCQTSHPQSHGQPEKAPKSEVDRVSRHPT